MQLLEQLLGEAGYTCVTSTMNPHEVCALHRKNRYDLILLDLQMPGMDGFAVMAGLKTSDADSYLPVIVLTAQPGHKLRALQAGAKDFISKPFDLVEVKTRIHNMLEVRLLYRKLEDYASAAGTGGAGADRRTARKRSALPEPDRAGLRLVLGAGRDRGLSPRCPVRSWKCSASGSSRWWARPAMTGRPAGTRRSARCCWTGSPNGSHSSISRLSRVNADGSQQQFRVSGEPMFNQVVPLHRLPRHRRGNDGRAIARKSAAPAMPSLHSHDQNHLLALLPAAELERFSAHLELVALPLGEMLYEPGGSCSTHTFPPPASCRCITSWSPARRPNPPAWATRASSALRCSWAGRRRSSSAVVQTAGHAYRLAGRLLKQEFDRAGLMQQLLLRYTQALMTQMSQTAVCNRHHSVEQQLCRWLLLTLDRAPSRELVMTQELVASMLGVRREGITEAAGNLQRAGVIRYRRGHIAVLERAGLETRVCECYAVVSKESTRLLADARCGQGAAQPNRRARMALLA